MKAAICRRYGPADSVVIEDIPTPRPAAGQVLVRVHASTVSTADHRIRGLDMPRGFGMLGRLMFGLTGPRRPVLGAELAGEVAAVGPGVTSFVRGDRVFAFPGGRGGGHAEYAVLPATSAICHTPDGLTAAQAAALSFGGTTALYFLRDRAAIQPGQSLLVIGAGGAVGSAAVQLGRAFGAHVSGMCSAAKTSIVLDLGAERVMAPHDTPPAGRQWDVIVDTVGALSFGQARDWLAPGGRLCAVMADLPQMIVGATARFGQGRRVIVGGAPERAQALADLAAMAVAGTFRPLIGLAYPLRQIALAHASAASGHKLGSTVVTMV